VNLNLQSGENGDSFYESRERDKRTNFLIDIT